MSNHARFGMTGNGAFQIAKIACFYGYKPPFSHSVRINLYFPNNPLHLGYSRSRRPIDLNLSGKYCLGKSLGTKVMFFLARVGKDQSIKFSGLQFDLIGHKSQRIFFIAQLHLNINRGLLRHIACGKHSTSARSKRSNNQ